MRRRRPNPGRPRNPIPRKRMRSAGPLLPPRARHDLQRAHRLQENGDHKNAALIFSRLAEMAFNRSRLRQAPMLFLQAAQSFALEGQSEQAISHGRRGLELLVETQRWVMLQQAGQRVIDTLAEIGQDQPAQELQDWLDNTLANLPTVKPPPTTSRRATAKLPLKCPSCGATVRPDEANWYDRTRAECAYCGSTLEASN
ncbi:MAG: hypothetical protein OEZ02_04335 [Anaerolineae bacterium]|nr:hypothetical protein [Anaerolineae bacterium]